MVVLPKYKALALAHSHSWAGHLGLKKMKVRPLHEFHWPYCFTGVENLVKSCDVCHRTGKPNEKKKVSADNLLVTKLGNKCILMMLCPATKFPEAVALKQPASAEIVYAMLSVFSRVGFPREVQSDKGSVFTSTFTTSFLERCGIEAIRSSVCNPQTNSVEKMRSVLKRNLRAPTFEHK